MKLYLPFEVDGLVNDPLWKIWLIQIWEPKVGWPCLLFATWGHSFVQIVIKSCISNCYMSTQSVYLWVWWFHFDGPVSFMLPYFSHPPELESEVGRSDFGESCLPASVFCFTVHLSAFLYISTYHSRPVRSCTDKGNASLLLFLVFLICPNNSSTEWINLTVFALANIFTTYELWLGWRPAWLQQGVRYLTNVFEWWSYYYFNITAVMK